MALCMCDSSLLLRVNDEKALTDTILPSSRSCSLNHDGNGLASLPKSVVERNASWILRPRTSLEVQPSKKKMTSGLHSTPMRGPFCEKKYSARLKRLDTTK